MTLKVTKIEEALLSMQEASFLITKTEPSFPESFCSLLVIRRHSLASHIHYDQFMFSCFRNPKDTFDSVHHASIKISLCFYVLENSKDISLRHFNHISQHIFESVSLFFFFFLMY